MKRKTRGVILAVLAVITFACGQENVVLPDISFGSGECGPWYPGGGDNADSGVYGIKEGKIFPCAVWEKARLNHQDTFINIGQEYLNAKHGKSNAKAVVIVVSSKGCTNCMKLISALNDRADDFDQAGAIMIAMARRVFRGSPDDPDLSIEQVDNVLLEEGWLVDRWPVINDEEHYFDTSFDDATPWIAVVDIENMMAMSVSLYTFSPDAQGVEDLLGFIRGFGKR